MDLEDKKILSKRRKRTAKVEECYFDLEAFFSQKKRFKPGSENEMDNTDDTDKHISVMYDKESLKRKIVDSYFSQLPEQRHS